MRTDEAFELIAFSLGIGKNGPLMFQENSLLIERNYGSTDKKTLLTKCQEMLKDNSLILQILEDEIKLFKFQSEHKIDRGLTAQQTLDRLLCSKQYSKAQQVPINEIRYLKCMAKYCFELNDFTSFEHYVPIKKQAFLGYEAPIKFGHYDKAYEYMNNLKDSREKVECLIAMGESKEASEMAIRLRLDLQDRIVRKSIVKNAMSDG
ncbi:hypothetical protein ACOME3_004580 [Neoechinorhynchus agilis]